MIELELSITYIRQSLIQIHIESYFKVEMSGAAYRVKLQIFENLSLNNKIVVSGMFEGLRRIKLQIFPK